MKWQPPTTIWGFYQFIHLMKLLEVSHLAVAFSKYYSHKGGITLIVHVPRVIFQPPLIGFGWDLELNECDNCTLPVSNWQWLTHGGDYYYRTHQELFCIQNTEMMATRTSKDVPGRWHLLVTGENASFLKDNTHPVVVSVCISTHFSEITLQFKKEAAQTLSWCHHLTLLSYRSDLEVLWSSASLWIMKDIKCLME